ncbi:hypothetical protein FEM08_23630 [Flavobacterium gilvum]|nr:hypothetical protein FEM08_23630 [Flavobacterium gilvum]
MIGYRQNDKNDYPNKKEVNPLPEKSAFFRFWLSPLNRSPIFSHLKKRLLF